MLEIGSFLSDRYEILSKVGAGGMSDVYKAKDHILSRFVAIKVLKQEFSEDSSFVPGRLRHGGAGGGQPIKKVKKASLSPPPKYRVKNAAIIRL